MSKKILFLSSAKLTALSIGLLLAVFCTIGMSFRPVYDDQEAADIVMSGPRRSHWTSGSCTTTYNNKTDYFRTIAQTRGNGTVYVSTAENSKTGASSSPAESGNVAGNESYVNWNSSSGFSGADTEVGVDVIAAAHSKQLYLWATPDDGYYFAGWSSKQETNDNASSDNPFAYTHSLTGEGYSSYASSQQKTYESADEPYKVTHYAFFSPVVIEKVSPVTRETDVTNARIDCEEYTGTIIFETTGADDMSDFVNGEVAVSQTGDGQFTIISGPRISGSDVILDYKFVGSGIYGSRNNTAIFTLTSKGDNTSSKTATITANYPNISLSGDNVSIYTIANSPSITGSFVVKTMFADGVSDFSSIPSSFAVESSTSGNWVLNSCVFNGTDFATGEGLFTINYTFTPNSTTGTSVASFTLTPKEGVGGTANELTIHLTANVEAPAIKDASVTIGNQTTDYETLADAIAAANEVPFTQAAPVIKLLRDVSISNVLSVTRTMTFDLNAFTLTGNLSASITSVLSVESQNAALTLCSSRAGGKVVASGDYAGHLSAVSVTKGKLLLQSGDLIVTNNSTNSAAQTMGVYLSQSPHDSSNRPTSSMSMTGGSINVNGHVNAYGIYCDGTGKNSSAADLRNAAITVIGNQNVYGAYLAGESPVNNMTITAQAESNVYAIGVNDGATVVVEDGSYIANATLSSARAILSNGTLRIQSGKYIANLSAADNLSDISGNDAVSIYVAKGTAAINDGSFTANAATGAYALHLASTGTPIANVAGGVFNAKAKVSIAAAAHVENNASLTTTGGTFRSVVSKTPEAAATLNAYGLLAVGTNSNVNINNSTFSASLAQPLGNYAYGVKAEGALVMNHCIATATATNNYAYGVYSAGGTITDCDLIKAEAGNTDAYGLYNSSGVLTTSNSLFQCESQQTRSFGGYIYGTLNAERTTFMAKAQASATTAGSAVLRGIILQTGAEATLNNCVITATGNSSYSQTVYGLYDKGTATVANTTITVSNVQSNGYALMVENARLTVNSGHFKAPTNALNISSPTGIELSGGFYTSNANLSNYLKDGCAVFNVPAGVTDFEAGYLYSIGTPSAPGYSVCKNVQTKKEYVTISEALEQVTSGQTIVLTADCSLPEGNYTIPSGATLLVPYDAAQVKANENRVEANCKSSYTNPSVFRTLTLESGAKLVVHGNLEMSAQIHADGQWAAEGSTTGKYGKLVIEQDAAIDVESGGHLYAWGYVVGEGLITIKKGGSAQEPFQIGDWPGGSNASTMNSKKKAFIVTHYFYQNIESKIKYMPGATAIGVSGTIMSKSVYAIDDVALVGGKNSGAMFLMDEDDERPETWVMKEYHANQDRIEWTCNSGASLGSLNIDAGVANIASKNFDLPITSNMTITLNYGEMQITQNVNFLPGSVLNIKKEGVIFIEGVKIGFFKYSDYKGGYYGARYSPSWGTTNPRGTLASGKSTLTLKSAYQKDAEMNVQGTFEVRPNGNKNGQLTTTTGGSYIHSTNADAGRIRFLNAAGDNTTIYYVGDGNNASDATKTQDVYPAQLQNEDGSYSDTRGTSANQLWGYKNDRWIKMQDGDCLYEEYADDGTTLTGVVNAYPSSFVEVAPNDPDDHAYHKAADVSKYVIFAEAATSSTNPTCTWWDAVPKEDGHYMISNEKSDLDGAYYYYDTDVDYWKPRAYKINWYNDNTLIIYNNVARNAKPKFTGKGYDNTGKLVSGKTVTLPTESGYNFTWDGWVTSKEDQLNQDCRVLTNEDMPRATSDITYYAHFKKEKKTYTVTFVGADGKTTIERLTIEHGEMPVCTAAPSKTSTLEEEYTLYWSANGTTTKYLPSELPVVTTAATYIATFQATPRLYSITFANSNGDVLKQENVAYGTSPTPPADPTRQNDGFYSYDFAGWKSGKVFIDKSENLPTVTGVTTYTAQYNTTDWTPEYSITFQNEDGTVLQTQHIRLGNSLVDPAETLLASGKLVKIEDAGYTYSFDGWTPVLIDKPTADAIYTAKYAIASTKQYTVTFKDEDGFILQSAKVNYGENPVYNKELPIKEQDAEWVYTFGGWEPEIEPVNGEQTYTAIYTKAKRKYTILFKNGDITFTNSVAPDNKWEYGIVPYIEGVTPTKEQSGSTLYAFDGWTPVATPVTNDMTYYAHFSETDETHTVTWKSWNGETTYDTKTVAYGAIPTYEGETTPTKEGDDEFDYQYDGWSNSINGDRLTPPLPVVGHSDVVFYAHFVPITKTYTVVWKNEDGSTLETDDNVAYGEMPSYDGVTPIKASNETNVFTFKSWDKTIASVTSDVTYTATYTSATTAACVTSDGNTAYFTTIDAAFADAGTKRDATIKVLQNVTRDNTQADAGKFLTYTSAIANNTCTLDLNNKTIDIKALKHTSAGISNGKAALNINAANTTFIITDNSTSQGGKISNTRTGRARYTAVAVNAGKLIVENGTILANNNSTSYAANTADAQKLQSCAIRLDDGAELIVHGGTIQSTATYNPYGVWVQAGSEATISGGTVNAIVYRDHNACGIYVDGGELTITDGAINATANKTNSFGAYGIYVNNGSATVNGGLINAVSKTTDAYDVYLTNSAFGVITGGKFRTSGTSNIAGVNGVAAANRMDISGGFFMLSDNIANYVKAPYGIRSLEESDIEFAEDYRYTISSTFDITVEQGEKQRIDVSMSANTTIVNNNAQIEVSTGTTLTSTNLVISATPSESSEVLITNANQVVADNVYFDLTRGAGKVFKHHTWYAFSVPFQVNASEILFDGQTMQYGQTSKKDDYDILYYDGSVRATSGKDASCWKYVENDEGANKFLYPGKLYMIANTRRDVTTLRFTKVTGTDLLNTSVDVNSYFSTTGNDADANWNGIANPAVFHANMDGLGTASSIAWEYNPDYSEDSSDPYRKIFLNSQDIILGQAFFAQVPTPQTLVVEPSYSSPSPVRRRLRESHEINQHYQVLIAREGDETSDDVIIRLDEDKEEDTYIIGTDLVRMGMSTMRPQLWVNRYNEKLCVNVMAPINGKANYPLGIFVPATGDYTLSLAAQPNDENMLYLTKDGRVIWNLTYGPYTGVFEQGTTSSYALRIVAAPKVTTDVEEAVVDAQGETRKVLINNQVFIIRGDQVYTIEGQLVK